MKKNQEHSLLEGFSKLSRQERYQRLVMMGYLTQGDIALLNSNTTPPLELGEKFIENVIGYFPMPMGVAVNFIIDGKPYAIPMAVEETSIIAAASKTAKWIAEHGSLTTEVVGECNIGQIQFAAIADVKQFETVINAHKQKLIHDANTQVAHRLVARGGGITQMQLRTIARPDGKTMAVIHVLVNTCDAMGANIINQICEYLKKPLEELTGERVTMCILSNLNDSKLVRAKVEMTIEAELAEKIAEASLFAELDPYRAATNNKGVLNGIDPILLATGNDWRAVESGIHSYAVQDGQYRSITRWRNHGNRLTGIFEAPIMLGVVGGMTKLHPYAQLCLKMLECQNGNDLARIVAAVGLTQNLGAIRALTTVGIIEGHMKLHIDNIILAVGATDLELPKLKNSLEEILKTTKRISVANAIDILKEMRGHNSPPLSNP